MSQPECFEKGYNDAKDGVLVDSIPNSIWIHEQQRFAWMSGWYAYHSGIENLNEGKPEYFDMYLKW